jgi:hypothetical protein
MTNATTASAGRDVVVDDGFGAGSPDAAPSKVHTAHIARFVIAPEDGRTARERYGAGVMILPLATLWWAVGHVGQDQFGRFPFVQPDASVAGGGTSWGIVRADERFGGWGRVCEEAFGPVVFFALEQPDAVGGPRILIGGVEGLSLTTDDGCSYTPVDNELAGAFASALWVDPDDAAHLLLGTSTVGAENGIWESTDGGDAWREFLPRRPGNFFNLAVSDDGARVAASGNDGSGGVLLLLSDDGGTTFVDVSAAVAARPLIHALLFDGDALILGGINEASEGTVDRVAFDGAVATSTALGTVPRETTHAVRFAGELFVLARNGARGELYVENGSALGFGLVQGGPSDCLVVRDGVLYGCGKQAGLNTSLFLRSTDGRVWEELVAFTDVHYRACPESTPGFAQCGNFLETACADDADNDLDGAADCDDDDCRFHPACVGEGEGEGEAGAGEGEGEGEENVGGGGAADSPGSCAGTPATAGLLAPLVLLVGRRRRHRG